MWKVLAVVGCLAALGLTACGGRENELSGSISESFSLDFDSVRIRKQNTTLLIEYLKKLGGSTAKVCKVVVDAESLPLKDNARISGDLFLERVSIQREAQTASDFPDVQGGKIKFDKISFKDGGECEGEFDAVFVNGRTIIGSFVGKIDEVVLE